MSSDWQTMLLGDFIELKRGYDLPKKQRILGRIPLISSAGLSDHHSEAKVKGPGVVTGRYGTIGQVFYVEDDFWPLNTTLYVRDFKGNNPAFVYYFLKTIDYLQYSDKAAVPGVNRNHLHMASVFVPTSVDEQKKIADSLGFLDDKIQLNQQINQTLEQMAQAIFKSWFVDFEPVKAKIAALEAGGSEDDALLAAMQVISGKAPQQLTQLQTENPERYTTLRATAELFPAAMQESELGEIPEGWEALPLYETAEYVNGAAFKAKDFSDDGSGLPIVKIAELKQGIAGTTKFTNGAFRERYLIDNGDVLYSWSGSPETSLEVFRWFGGKGWLNQHIFKINFDSTQNIHFVFFLLRQIKPLLIRTAQQKQTTGLGHITVADMKRIKIPYQEHNLLSAFSRIVSPLYNRGSNTIKESAMLAELRDTLLPKLLSGELSVSDLQTTNTEAAADV